MKIILKLLYYISNSIVFIIVFPILIFSRFINKKVEIGIGPYPLINNVYWSKALTLKGYSVETFVTSCYKITCQFDVKFQDYFFGLFLYFPSLGFLRNCFRYSIIYQYFNGGMLSRLGFPFNYFEPFLYKLSGVKIVVMPYGSDSQILLHTPNKLWVNSASKDYPSHFKYSQKNTLTQTKRWTRNASFVIAAMDSVDYLEYWDYLLPCHFAIDRSVIVTDHKNFNIITKRNIKIFHAFNHVESKGTKYLDRAIERLIDEGYDIEYIKLTNVSNIEVKEAIQSADLIVDQLIMGFYGMFALEAMSMGKPVICFIRDDLMKLYTQLDYFLEDEFPIINANVSNIYDKLKDIVINPEQLADYRMKSLKFIEKNNSLEAIGSIFDKINKQVLNKNELESLE